MAAQDPESDPIANGSSKSRLSRLTTRFYSTVSGAQKLFFALAVIAALISGACFIVISWQRVVTISPIATPNDLVTKGYTAEVTQKIFHEDLQAIFDSASSVMPTEVHETLDSGEGDFHLQIPETGMSLQDVVKAAKTALKRDGLITAEIVKEGEKVSLSGRVVRPGGQSRSFYVENDKADVRKLLSDGAEEVMKAISPYVAASSGFARAMKKCDDHIICDFSNVTTEYERILDPKFTTSQDRVKFARWAHLGLSKIAEVNRDYLTEIEHARQALRDHPHFAWARYNWGVALEKMGCEQDAFRLFNQAVSDRRSVPENHNALGLQYLRFARSVDDEEPASRHMTRLPEEMIRGDPALQAESEFQKAIEADPQYVEAHLHLGESFELQKRYEKALDQLKKAASFGGEYASLAYDEVEVITVKLGDTKTIQRAIDGGNLNARHHPQCSGDPESSILASDHCTNATASTVVQPTDWHVPEWPNDSFSREDCAKYSRDDWP